MYSNTMNNLAGNVSSTNLYANTQSSPSVNGTLSGQNYLDSHSTGSSNPLIHYFNNPNQNISDHYLGTSQAMNYSTIPSNMTNPFNPSSSSSNSSCSSSSDTLIADLDFLLTTNNGTHLNSPSRSQMRYNNNNINIRNLNIVANNQQRPPPLSTPAINNTYHHDDQQHQQLVEDQHNQMYALANATAIGSTQPNTCSLTNEDNLLNSTQNCLINSDFNSFPPSVNAHHTATKHSIDLTGDLDSILLDTHIINNNTANYFIESMQALHNLDSRQGDLDLGTNLTNLTNVPKHSSPMNHRNFHHDTSNNNSTASSSSSASSSTTLNTSIDAFDTLISTPLDLPIVKYEHNSGDVQGVFSSKNELFNELPVANKFKPSLKSNKHKQKADGWDSNDFNSLSRKRGISHMNPRSVPSSCQPEYKSYSMPGTPNNNNNNQADYGVEMSSKKFKYDIKQDMTETDVELNSSVTYPKYKRYDEFKCWVCGDQSSGNHYGALTCEACKLFFRRHSTAITTTSLNNNNTSNSPSSINSGTSSTNEPKILTQCAQRNCQITVQTRSSCPECRYRKCIAVGMGLNRTTFGRHTTVQKVRYNTRVTDLFAEIMKLFVQLKESLNSSNKANHTNDPLLIPSNTSLTLINQTTSNLKLIESKSDLENNLFKFYNEVIDLIMPIQNPAKVDSKTDIKCPLQAPLPVQYMSTNTLIAFCLIFGYNLRTSGTSVQPTMNNAQIQNICKQIKELNDQFSTFAMRIKIIYFLLIMYTSHSANAVEELEPCRVDSSGRTQFQSNYQFLSNQHSANTTNQNSVFGYANSQANVPITKTNYFEEFIEDTSNIQRTFLDLLNSELDFQQNTVSSARVSLLLKLDQFV